MNETKVGENKKQTQKNFKIGETQKIINDL